MAKVKVGSVWDFSMMQNDIISRGNYEVVWQRGNQVGVRRVDIIGGTPLGGTHIFHSSHFTSDRRVK